MTNISMIHIKIIRHAERLDRRHPLYWMICIGQYWADAPLTSNGHASAKDKGTKMANNHFRPKCIFTSPYIRTMATAIEIKTSFPDINLVIEPLLAEYQPYYKHYIGLYPQGIPTTYGSIQTEFTYPETYDQFARRVMYILQKILDKKEDCCVVTHGEVIKYLLYQFQTLFPNLLLDITSVPYLTVLSFAYNTVTETIDETTVRVE